MPLKIRIASTALSEQAKAIFVSDTRRVFGAYRRLRELARIPACHVEVVVTDRFVADAAQILATTGSPEGDRFSADRVGGVVGAKNIPLAPDYSRVAIVFDAAQMQVEGEPNIGWRMHTLQLVAHELAHPLLQRALQASGVLEGEPAVPWKGSEVMRAVSRWLAEEYRADRLADIVLRAAVAVPVDGEMQPVGGWDAFGDSYRDALAEVLERAYPAWPETVQRYRIGQIDLQTLWESIANSIRGTLIFLMHCQAMADAAEKPSLLEDARFASLPAVRLYLAEQWARFMEAVRKYPLLPAMREVGECDEEIVRVGESVLREILGYLGLKIEDHPDGQWALWVGAPVVDGEPGF